MLNDNYLEKILGEQYNMSDYFENVNNNEIDIEQMQVGNNNNNNSQINYKYDLYNNYINKDNKDNNEKNEQKNKPVEEAKSKGYVTEINKDETVNDENALGKKTAKANSSQIKNENNLNIKETTTKNEDVIKVNSNLINNRENNNKVKEKSKNNNKTIIGDLKKLYPDIHKVLEPIVNLLVKNYSDKNADENLVKTITDKIYYAVESTNNDDTVKINKIPNKKDNKRIKNGLLYDLIKILVLNRIIEDKT